MPLLVKNQTINAFKKFSLVAQTHTHTHETYMITPHLVTVIDLYT